MVERISVSKDESDTDGKYVEHFLGQELGAVVGVSVVNSERISVGAQEGIVVGKSLESKLGPSEGASVGRPLSKRGGVQVGISFGRYERTDVGI